MQARALVFLLALCACSATAASSTQAPPEVAKSVDAHAVAFTGKHCASEVTTRPPVAESMANFNTAVKKMDGVLNEYTQQDPTVQVRSSVTGKTLWRAWATSGTTGRSIFMVMYHDRGAAYFYRCFLG